MMEKLKKWGWPYPIAFFEMARGHRVRRLAWPDEKLWVEISAGSSLIPDEATFNLQMKNGDYDRYLITNADYNISDWEVVS